MQFLGKTIWVCKLPREVAFFIWIFFLITCIKGKCILVISYVFLVNIKNGFLLLFFVVFNKCLSNAQHNEICQYCRNQIMGLFFLMGVWSFGF